MMKGSEGTVTYAVKKEILDRINECTFESMGKPVKWKDIKSAFERLVEGKTYNEETGFWS